MSQGRHNVITVCNVFVNKSIGEMISLVRTTFRRHANDAGLILSIFMFKPMFKQRVNLLI